MRELLYLLQFNNLYTESASEFWRGQEQRRTTMNQS